MHKRYYRNLTHYRSAVAQNERTVQILERTRKSILMLGSKMPEYWHDSYGDNVQMKLIEDIDQLIKDLQDENS